MRKLQNTDWQWRALRPLVALGDASYALYLLHPLLLDQSSHLRVRLPAGSLLAPDAFLLALPVAISAISLLWFRWIEWPLFNRAAASGWARRLIVLLSASCTSSPPVTDTIFCSVSQ